MLLGYDVKSKLEHFERIWQEYHTIYLSKKYSCIAQADYVIQHFRNL
jgi:hypothetical protein